MQYGSAELRIKETKDKTKRAGMDISFLALVVILFGHWSYNGAVRKLCKGIF